MSGRSAESTMPRTKLAQRGSRSPSNSSEMKTLLTKSLTLRDGLSQSCCSKGAMLGTYSRAVNSIVPSTLKCAAASGSRNSLKVVLKKASYSAFSTSLGLRVHSGALSFWRAHENSARGFEVITGLTGSAFSRGGSSALAAASAASWALSVAAASSTSS